MFYRQDKGRMEHLTKPIEILKQRVLHKRADKDLKDRKDDK